jgi:proteasome lid subunit RPN8/RPN11
VVSERAGAPRPADPPVVAEAPAGAEEPAERGTRAAPTRGRAVRLPRVLRDELVDWARRGYPNEACGILSGTRPHDAGGAPLAFHGLSNAAASPYRYLVDPDEQLRLMLALDEADQVVWAIFHSHVRSPAEPSPTDIGLAFYPDALYLICSLAEMDAPVLRAWQIRDGRVAEVPLEIEG